MKTLIVTAFLTLTMNAFAEGQVYDIDCTALAESTDRVAKDVSQVSDSQESVKAKSKEQ